MILLHWTLYARANAAKAFDSGLSGKSILLGTTVATDQVSARKASGEAIRPVASAMMEIDPEPAKNQRHVEFAKQEATPVKGGLPQGFFYNKDVDLRARDVTRDLGGLHLFCFH
ncbi:hypothetical protein Droror1_Dr00024064 [Drosera rotundifolia]